MKLNVQSSTLEPRPAGSTAGCAVEVYPVHNQVGESPVWDAPRQCLWWIDVRRPELLRLHPASGALLRWALPEPVGAAVLRPDGDVWLALRTQAWRFTPETATLVPFATIEAHRPENRLNEGKASPSGRWVLVGSMHDVPQGKQALGALYRVGEQGDVVRLHQGLTTANGLGWSPDGTRLFFSDSAAGLIWTADWDEARGTLGTVRRFARSDEAQGRPDGCLVLDDGGYVSAGVSAGCLNLWAPDGTWLARIPLPCRAPTMPCMAGGARDGAAQDGPGDVFVTSLVRPDWAPDPLQQQGQLYAVRGLARVLGRLSSRHRHR